MASDAQALILQVSADTSKAEKRLKAFEDKLKGIGKTIDKVSNDNQHKLDGLFGHPGQAFDKIFDATRFKLLDTGAARIGLFGSSLEKLGVIGLSTAAIIGAVAFALNQASEAVKFGAEIERTADKVHVTTDFLQELRFALKSVSGESAGADQALESFSTTLGKASGNNQKALEGFRELFGRAFSAEDVKKLGDPAQALLTVAEKISNLKSPEQRDSAVSLLGLDGVKELVENVDELTKGLAAANASGNVLTEDLVRGSKGAQKELDEINGKIKVEMTAAFIGLKPVILSLNGLLSDMLTKIVQIIDGFKPLQDRSRFTLQSQLTGAQSQNEELLTRFKGVIPLSKHSQFEHNKETITRNTAALAARDVADETNREIDALKPADKRTGSLTPRPSPHAGPSPQSQQKHFDEQLARVTEQILSASDDDLHTVLERQDIARRRLSLEDNARRIAIVDEVRTKAITAAHGQMLLAEQDKLLLAKSSQLRAEQEQAIRLRDLKLAQDLAASSAAVLDAQLGLTRSVEERAALESEILIAQRSTAKKVLLEQLRDDPNKSPIQKAIEIFNFNKTTAALVGGQNLKTFAAINAEQEKVAQATLDAQLETLNLQDQLADTAKQKRDAELKILDLQYEEQRKRILNIIAISNNTAEIEASKAQLQALDANHAAQTAVVNKNTRGPLEQFTAGLPLDPAKLDEALQNVAAHGLQSLEDGLVSVIGHTKKLGDVFREVATSIIADLARIAIQRAIIGPLENVLTAAFGGVPGLGNIIGGGKAIGGPVFPGHIYPVGERGVEGFVPGVAGSIIPHSAIREAATMGGGRSVTVLQTVQFHAEGAVWFKDFTLQQNRTMVALASAAARESTQASLRGVTGALAQSQQHAG